MKKSKFKNLRVFAKYYKPYLGIVVLDLICACLSTVCELVLPMIIRHITNTAQNGTMDTLMSSVLRLGVIYLFLRIVDTFANYYMSDAGHVMGTKMETDMRRDMFEHLMKQSFTYFNNTKVGQIMSRISNDLFDITEFAHHCPEELFICGIKIVGSFIILCGINVPLTLIMFAILPLMLVSVIFFRKGMKEAFKKQREQIGELNSQVEDTLLGIRVVKSFANEEKEMHRFEEGNRQFFNRKKISYKYMARFHACTRFFDGAMYVVIIIVGSLFMIKRHINAADLVAYLLYIQTLIASIRKLVEFTEQFQRGITGIDRFCEVMDVEPDIKDAPDAVELDNIDGSITFENVSFNYNDDEKVLKDISLSIESGKTIALVGPSGGGKTTICSLIPRFYDVTDGSIKLDGTDIKDIKAQSLRRNIGIVQQDVYMFYATIRENIAYGKEGATDEEIIEAAKKANIHDFIMSLPEGYDTFVGERGTRLSGGQKQRISIARVFLKNPPILILDEATSALDNESERYIQHSLEDLSHGRTTLVIAHRLSTIRNADKIYVIEEGNIKEQGSHDELLAADGIYARYYNMQFDKE